MSCFSMHSLTAYSFLAECGRSRKRFAFFVATSGCIFSLAPLLGTGAGFRGRALISVMVSYFGLDPTRCSPLTDLEAG